MQLLLLRGNLQIAPGNNTEIGFDFDRDKRKVEQCWRLQIEMVQNLFGARLTEDKTKKSRR